MPRLEAEGGFATTIDAALAEFIAKQRSFYLATANADGQPYIQHRGGPRASCACSTSKTLAFADFSGNRQYISTGNLADNAEAMLFLMDYANRRRVKIWGTARVGRGRSRPHRHAVPRGLQGARRAGHRLHRRGLGHQLPAAYPADVLRRGCRRGGRCAASGASPSSKPRMRGCGSAPPVTCRLDWPARRTASRTETPPANAPSSSATMKPGASAGAMPANVSLRAARDGHRRIGERGRGGEPIGRGDVEADRGRHRLGLEADAAENGRDQPERGDELSRPLARARCAPSSRAGSGRARTSDARARRRRSRRRSAPRHRRAPCGRSSSPR